MSISRPFAYNPTLQTDGVSEQFGTLSVGFQGQSYSNQGGLKWWNGPDEELGYTIGTSIPSGGPISPDGTPSTVGFWRTSGFSDPEFIQLSNSITGQNFSDTTQANQYLRSNGYWTSIEQFLNKLYVGGTFNMTVSPENFAPRIISLNSDGSVDQSKNFGNGTNSSIVSIQSQSTGKIIVGGSFNYFGNDSANLIVRLNTDGSYDSTFNSGGTGFTVYSISVFSSNVNSIQIQNDDKIIAAGSFSGYNQTVVSNIVRLNSDGSIDTSFNTSTNFDNSSVCSVIQLLSDGKIMVGGNFTSFGQTTVNNLLRLNSDGTRDSSFNLGSGQNIGFFGFATSVNDISIQSDQKVVVGGQFTGYRGTTSSNIVRINIDGSIDTSFVVGTGFNGSVEILSIQNDQKIVVGGTFTEYQGTSVNRITRLNTDGTLDSTFVIGNGFPSSVNSVKLQSDGKIILGGIFTSYNDNPSNGIVRLNSDGTIDEGFNVGGGFDGSISSILFHNNNIILGGAFNSYNNNNINSSLLGFFENGSNINTFNIDPPASPLSSISNIFVLSNGELIVGGSFTSLDGVSSNRIAKLNVDGSYNTSFDIGSGFNLNVFNIIPQLDEKIIVGGSFTAYQGISRNRIVRLNTDGSYDTSFDIGTGFNNIVEKVAIQNDGKLVVVGSFTSYSGITSNRIVRLNTDGSYDTSFNTGVGFNGTPTNVYIDNDKIVVGGVFTEYQGVISHRLCRLNSDGSYDSSFDIGSKLPAPILFQRNTLAISLDFGSKVIVGGDVTSFGSTPVNRIFRLNSDATIDTSFNVGQGIYRGAMSSIHVFDDGKILLNGLFISYNLSPRINIAILNSDGTVYDAFNSAGVQVRFQNSETAFQVSNLKIGSSSFIY